MNIVTVIPLVQGAYKEDLTYFTAKEVAPGTIVSVPLRKKIVDALVVAVEHLTNSKSQIKLSPFALKKIETVKGPMPFYSEFWRAVGDAKTYFLGTSGATLFGLVPKIFFDEHEQLALPRAREQKQKKIAQEKLLLQVSFDDRIAFYKTYIREAFAKKQSVFFCLPTIRDAEKYFELLKKGVEEHIFLFHGEEPDKEILANYNRALESDHPVIIIATGSYLFIPRHDLSTIIVERESSSAYKQMTRPYADIRTFAEFLSYRLGIKLIYADTFLRAETIYRVETGEFSEIGHLSFHLSRSVKREIIDSKRPTDDGGIEKKEGWKMIHAKLETQVRTTLENGGRIFLFALRKGFAPITQCGHCEKIHACALCTSPLVLYEQKSGKRIFSCNKCGTRSAALLACANCESWKLMPLGVGSEGVAEEIQKLFPKVPVHLLDKEHAKTKRQAEKTAEAFYANASGILVGTEMALPYLKEKVALAAIVSFDSLFAIPSFRAGEKIVSLVSLLEQASAEKLIIQTKNTDEYIIKEIALGNLAEFYKKEIAERRQLGYPPFTTLVKASYQDKKIDPDKIHAIVEETFKPLAHKAFQSPVFKTRNVYATHTILKLERNDWSPEKILKKDHSIEYIEAQCGLLPMNFNIIVEPEDIS